MNRLLLCIMLVTLWTGMLFAQTATPPASGDGSSGAPYQIASLDNLYWISASDAVVPSPNRAVRWAAYYEQTANINASATSGWDSNAGWSPIGNSTTQFTGNYNGQEHTISGLFIDRSATYAIGFFGYTEAGAVVQNVGLLNVDITGDYWVGTLVGMGVNCSISKCYSTGSVSGTHDVGGFVGRSHFASGGMSNCYSTASVNATDATSSAGGFVGYQNTGTISYCYSTGLVTGNDNTGGFKGNGGGTLVNSFWDTETSGQLTSSGGYGRSTALMKTHTTFTDYSWDFEIETANGTNNYWDMDYSTIINNGYPYLSWQDGGEVSLPVELSSFSARCKGESIILEWITESETDNLGFILERSETDKSWETVASYTTHNALKGQGNTTNRTEYAFTDAGVKSGVEYAYRLSDVNAQGEVTTLASLSIKLKKLPETTVMANAYPNPFNPQTNIAYQLAQDADVNITVFDLLGRRVQALYSGQQLAGSHHVSWNGENENGLQAPSGVYLIRMQTENITQVQKVMLLK